MMIKKRGFSLSEVLMAFSLLAVLLVMAVGILQWALYGSQTQQANTRAAFLAQAKLEELVAQTQPSAATGTLEEVFHYSATVQPLDDDLLELSIEVRGPAGARYRLSTQRRASLREVLVRAQPEQPKLYCCSEDFQDQQELEGDSGLGQFALSPGGDQLAYVKVHEGRPQIWVRGLQEKDDRLLFEHPGGAQEPAWSPDGKKLAFTAQENGFSQVMVFDWKSHLWENWSKSAQHDNSPTWCPNGKELVAVRNTDSLVLLGNGKHRVLIENPGGWTASPSVSPDGRQLVFMANHEGNPDIYLGNFEGGLNGCRRLTEHSARDERPRFSKDGKRILFLSDREEQRFGAYSMNLDGDGLVRISREVADCLWLF